jgi:hypothetical protein
LDVISITLFTSLANLATAFEFGAADLAAASGVFVTAAFLVGFWDHGWNFEMFARAVDCDEGQVCRTDVLGGIGDVVLDVHLDADFHRCMENAING